MSVKRFPLRAGNLRKPIMLKYWMMAAVSEHHSKPARRTAAEEDRPFPLELIDPAPAQTGRSLHQKREPALIQTMDSLVDAVAGLEARVTCHFQQLVTQLAQLQKDVDELKCTRTSAVLTPACVGVQMPFNPSQSLAVADFAYIPCTLDAL